MFRARARFYALAAGLLAVNASGLVWIRHSLLASRLSGIRVLAALPERDVDATDKLILVLDEPLVSHRLIGEPLAQSPFEIDPRPDGRWLWAAPDRLEYRLDRVLPAGNAFRVTPVADFEVLTGRRLVGKSVFEFQTRSLQLEKCEFTMVERNAGQLTFGFNQPVNPHDLAKHLCINGLHVGSTSNEHSAIPLRMRTSASATSWLTKEANEQLVLQVRRPPDSNISIEIDSELAGAEGHLPLGKAIKRRFQFDRVLKLDSAYVPSVNFGDPTVHLDFSHYLDRDQAPPTVTLDPAVDDVFVAVKWDELRLHGPFEPGRRYTATVAGNLLASNETTLGESQSISFEIPDRSSGLRFVFERGILNPHGNLAIDLEAVNVPGVDLRVARVTGNNIVPHLRGEDADATSRNVVDRTLALNLRQNQAKSMALDLRDLLGSRSPLGIYRIDAESSEQAWVDDHAIIAVTDLAITAKIERNGLWAWVTSLSSGKPVEGATVRAVSYNNQILAEGVSGADGTVQMRVPEGPDGPVWGVIAERGEDIAYLQPDRRTWVLDDVDQSGRDIPAAYDVMLYAERGVYRPGDVIHLTGIIRDAQGAVPPTFPLALDVRRPDGKRVETLQVSAAGNQQGVFQVDYPTDDTAQMGRYRFDVSIPGASKALGGTSTLVEAFLPVRIEVDAAATESRYGPGETPEMAVAAQYLFGKPAAGLPVTLTNHYRSISFHSQRFPDFSFGDADIDRGIDVAEVKAALNEAGKANMAAALPEGEKGLDLWRASWCITVTEPGSRSVSKSLSAVIDTVNHHLGLRSAAGRVVRLDQPVAIEWAQVNGADEPAKPHPATIAVSRIDYDWAIKEIDGRQVWETKERLTLVTSESLPVNAGSTGTFAVKLPAGGRYRVLATDEKTHRRTSIELYATADPAEAELLALNRPERLELVLDQETYEPGSTASVLVRSPFPGTLVLTIESDRVVHHQMVELTGNTATVDLPIPSSLRGGAFLTGTLVRPIDPQRDEWLPHRAMGMARLIMDHTGSSLDVEIAAPATAQPDETISVSVTVDRLPGSAIPPMVHLWAVDDGILLPTHFETPDPGKFFFAPRESVVETADMFADLLPDIKRPESFEHIGADDDDGSLDELRRNPVAVKRRAPTIVWNTIAEVDTNGCATWNIALPDVTGRLRFMAVAVDGDRYGKAAQEVTLTAPLLVEANWPRFVAPGDRFDVPVKLFNDLPDSITVAVSTKIDGPVDLDSGPLRTRINVKAGESKTVWLAAQATGIGPVTARVTAEVTNAECGPLSAKAEARFPVRPTAPLHVASQCVRVAPDQPVMIDPPSGFVTGTTRTKVRISAQPNVDLLSAFEAVVDYPYGCVEQTTSRLYALLYAQNLFEAALPDDIRTQSIPEMIRLGLARLHSMQTHSGGLAYWPGGIEPSLWGSAYAGGFLAEAKQAGYEPDASLLKDLTGYLERALRPGSDAAEAPNIRALICRVLAELGDPPVGWMAQLSEQADQLDRGGRAQLAAAWMAAGRRDRALPLLTDSVLDEAIATRASGRITSSLRQDALLLHVLCEVDAEHPRIPRLVERIDAARQNGRWHSTLDNATALAALATYQAGVPTEPQFTGELLIGGQHRLSFDQSATAACTIEDLAESLTLTTQGTSWAYANIETEGLLADTGVTEYDHQLQVQRRWTNGTGKAIDPNRIQVGDLIHVEITLQAPALDAYESIDNIAIVDAIPGGMEVENPRLDTSAQVTGQSSDTPDRVEFLDDRVVLFASAKNETKRFQYLLRATTAGSFCAPPIQASSMYDAAYASLHAGTPVEILR